MPRISFERDCLIVEEMYCFWWCALVGCFGLIRVHQMGVAFFCYCCVLEGVTRSLVSWWWCLCVCMQVIVELQVLLLYYMSFLTGFHWEILTDFFFFVHDHVLNAIETVGCENACSKMEFLRYFLIRRCAYHSLIHLYYIAIVWILLPNSTVAINFYSRKNKKKFPHNQV